MRSTRASRRTFLKAAGLSLALPPLESLLAHTTSAAEAVTPPQRLVCMANPLGMYPSEFFPAQAGADYELPAQLKSLATHRKELTIFSNLDHDLGGGHRAVHTFLSGVPIKDARAMPEGNITLDQRAAEFVETQTRFPSLNLGVAGGCDLSWTRSGVHVPPITSARAVFRKLFVDETAAAKEQLRRTSEVHASILDAVGDQAHALSGRLGARDKQKLDEYFTAVRDLEKQLGGAQKWLGEKKPAAVTPEPAATEFVDSLPIFCDLVALALHAGLTRVVTLEIPFTFNTADLGLTQSYHAYSHHGKAEANVKGLKVIEQFQIDQLARLLTKLKALDEPSGGGNLLDHTMVLFGSGMGNGSSHSNKNLPVLLAGGGFRHGQHLVLPPEKQRRVPLCNLLLTLLQNFGVPADRFGTSTGTIGQIV